MKHLVHAELRKLTTVRSPRAIAAGVIAIAVVAVIPAWTAPAVERATFTAADLVGAVRGPAFVVAVAALVAGVLATAGELRHGTMAATLLVAPHRRKLVAAKATAAALSGAAVATAASLVTVVLSAMVLASAGVDTTPVLADALLTVGALVAIAMAYAVAGVGIGLAVRDQTAAVVGALVWVTVVENVLPVVLRAPALSRWLPGGAARAVLAGASPEPGLLGPALGGLLLVATVAVLVGLGTAAFVQRDVD